MTTPSDRERAKGLLSRALCNIHQDGRYRRGVCDDCLAAEFAAVRAETIEACAKEAEAHTDIVNGWHIGGVIADRIRALAAAQEPPR